MIFYLLVTKIKKRFSSGGQSILEYVLICALIGIALIFAVISFRSALVKKFEDIRSALTSKAPTYSSSDSNTKPDPPKTKNPDVQKPEPTKEPEPPKKTEPPKEVAPSQKPAKTYPGDEDEPTDDRYFPKTMDPKVMVEKAKDIDLVEAKRILNAQVASHWNDIKDIFGDAGITTVRQAQAFFLGVATRESSDVHPKFGRKQIIRHYLETGGTMGDWDTTPGHSYGVLQTAETAYKGAGAKFTWTKEEDPGLKVYWYKADQHNFYDPGVSCHMGIRKIVYWMRRAKKDGFKGKDLLRAGCYGHNIGQPVKSIAELDNHGWYNVEVDYSAAYHLYGNSEETNLPDGHMTDDKYTFTGEYTQQKKDKAPKGTNWAWASKP